ncbi:unnamed protein product [Rotaria magnacalcarata]|nr:unnamed protein product [Rotaria magnacalcarata]CAF1586869.1 unnamed protein product [Rotaria magnacalcarata]CAF2071106.1 unnamed protein product [Rotaria magnacalcarata]CAF4187802.1 unnamed protein product [Rotaria magnacalcarata]CAF4220552.1 unnamed protein product [Rotaria magnacalcarata]
MSTISVRKLTARRIVSRPTKNDLTFLPPPPAVSISMNNYSTNNVENGSERDHVVPQAGCNKSKQLPVIKHNKLKEYYRSPPDARVFRYRNSSSRISNNQQQPKINSSRMGQEFIYVD